MGCEEVLSPWPPTSCASSCGLVDGSGAAMNINVDRDLFLSDLFYLQGVACAKQLIPILSYPLIEAAPGKIAVRAMDLDVAVTTECAAVVREGGSICLPARKLAEIVKSLAHGEIEIKTNDTNAIERFALRTSKRRPIVHRRRAAGSPPWFQPVDRGAFPVAFRRSLEPRSNIHTWARVLALSNLAASGSEYHRSCFRNMLRPSLRQ